MDSLAHPPLAIGLLLLLLAAPLMASAQQGERPHAAPPTEFDTYQLVLLRRPAEPREYPEEKLREIQGAHLGHLRKMAMEGHLVVAGPFADQPDESLRGLALYRVGSVERARALASADPAVQAGRLEVEVMTWYTQKGALAFPGLEGLRDGEQAEETGQGG